MSQFDNIDPHKLCVPLTQAQLLDNMTGLRLLCHTDWALHKLITLLPLCSGWEPPRTINSDHQKRLSIGSAKAMADDAQSFALIADLKNTGLKQVPLLEQPNNHCAEASTTQEKAALLIPSAASSR